MDQEVSGSNPDAPVITEDTNCMTRIIDAMHEWGIDYLKESIPNSIKDIELPLSFNESGYFPNYMTTEKFGVRSPILDNKGNDFFNNKASTQGLLDQWVRSVKEEATKYLEKKLISCLDNVKLGGVKNIHNKNFKGRRRHIAVNGNSDCYIKDGYYPEGDTDYNLLNGMLHDVNDDIKKSLLPPGLVWNVLYPRYMCWAFSQAIKKAGDPYNSAYGKKNSYGPFDLWEIELREEPSKVKFGPQYKDRGMRYVGHNAGELYRWGKKAYPIYIFQESAGFFQYRIEFIDIDRYGKDANHLFTLDVRFEIAIEVNKPHFVFKEWILAEGKYSD